MKKNILASVLTFAVLLAVAPAWAVGSGLPGDPYVVRTAEELDRVRDELGASYRLDNDIDLTAYLAAGGAGHAKWGAAGWLPLGDSPKPFAGNFDGAGHKITGLWIDRKMQYVGLFGDTENATFKDLGVEIAAKGIRGGADTGGLVGYLTKGSIENCYVTGNVTGEQSVGGLAGVVGGSLANCYATGNVRADLVFAGGLAGYQLYGSIAHCYAAGSVVGGATVGGLVGFQDNRNFNKGSIADSYAVGNVEATEKAGDAGGLVGVQYSEIEGDSSISNCYATGNVTAKGDEGNAGGLVGSQAAYENGSSSVANCYATGNVRAKGNAGGLIGEQHAYDSLPGTVVSIKNSFRYELVKANGGIPSLNDENGIHGGVKTAVELMTQATYEGNGWTFSPFAWRWSLEKFPCLNMGTEKFPFHTFFTDDDDDDKGSGGGGCNAGHGLFALALAPVLFVFGRRVFGKP